MLPLHAQSPRFDDTIIEAMQQRKRLEETIGVDNSLRNVEGEDKSHSVAHKRRQTPFPCKIRRNKRHKPHFLMWLSKYFQHIRFGQN